jgi:hypothetical protein
MPGKRRHKRIIKRLETEFSAAGIYFRGISSDLSGSGLFVRTTKPFPPDTLVDLTVHLPEDLFARLKGVVRHAIRTGLSHSKNGMGIEIVEYDQNFVAFINSLLPPEEHIRYQEIRKGGAAEAGPIYQQAALHKDKPAPPAKKVCSPAPMKRAVVSAKKEHDGADETIDDLLSSLFPKKEKK